MKYLMAVAFFGLVGIIATFFYSPSQKNIVFQIEGNTSARAFVHVLKKEHLIRSEPLFLAWIRLRGLSTQLKAGIYQVQLGESAEDILQRVVKGDVLQGRFQMIEGT